MTHDLKTDCPHDQSSPTPEETAARRIEDLIDGLSCLDGVSPEDAADALADRSTEHCPEPNAWLRVTIGEPGPEEMESLLSHAAVCRTCSERLRQSLHLLSEDVLPEEVVAVGRLETLSTDWQQKLAAELASTPLREEHKRHTGVILWVGAALAAMLAIALGVTAWWLHVNAPERMIAQAYSNSRPFDLRIPFAGYGEVVLQDHLRGGAASREPSALVEAKARIERHLAGSSPDSHWLELKARAEILEEKFDPAIEILDRLLATGPATASIYVDDATAYFQRGTISGSESDRTTALEYLRRADEQTPGNPVVLFNEALVMEDRGQAINAIETWNRYLNFERDPRWKAEGQRRLEALKKNLSLSKPVPSRGE